MPREYGKVRHDKRIGEGLSGAISVPHLRNIIEWLLRLGQGRAPSKRIQEEARLGVEIRAAHQRTRETYGAVRLQNNLVENGVEITIHRVRRMRKKRGICCKQTRKFKSTTNSKHALPVAPNLARAEIHSNRPESDMGYRHHLYPDRPGLALLGLPQGCV